MAIKTHEAPHVVCLLHPKNFQFKKDFVGIVAVFD